ncbi:hypothetical protein A3H26_04025 [candidate division WWE3 bacterium RIFCSPLOWO2_12_FULL_36_10]|uniref:Response regulatory domain-containing protein n=1 Tax=candidate division WWE3 bacterium RIFCSPLOWO2_12_FULL_36_10 TaxID=1802630 RepID=A0A1F4VKC4_UNCKA|nr:MAG: hypothetical protein A3H26_04025 [candidate division WWE3 bacterium RIFCSPLOWO2_12_FULL_36_10]
MGKALRILHVDDDDDWLRQVQEVLERARHEVYSCVSMADAYFAYDRHGPFDIVICDGNVDSPDSGDGLAWALLLHGKRQKVVTLFASIDGIEGIPHLNKGEYSLQALLDLVR